MIQPMNKKIFSTAARRMAVLLLMLCLSATTTWAELTIRMNDESLGRYEVSTINPRIIFVYPNDGYCVKTVAWHEFDDDSSPRSTLVNLYGWYESYHDYGFIDITFAAKTDDVRVAYYRADHDNLSAAPELWYRKLGEKAVHIADPTADGYLFMGWCTDLKGTKPYDFDTELTSSLPYEPAYDAYVLKLYAKWSEDAFSGSCGTGVTWEITQSKEGGDYDQLTISGSGAMKDYASNIPRPWKTYYPFIKHIVIGEGVTKIGDKAFEGCTNVEADIVIPSSVTEIGEDAFKKVATDAPRVISISVDNGSKLSTIDKSAFDDMELNIDLSNATGYTIVQQYSFDGCAINSHLILPSSVKTVGRKAFYKLKGKNADACIIFSNSSETLTIDKSAFENSAINIDLSGTTFYTLPEKTSIFKRAKGNVTLPSCLGLIEGNLQNNGKKRNPTAFNEFGGSHIYIPVPAKTMLRLNGENYNGALTDGGMVNLVDYLFKLNKRTKDQSLSITMVENGTEKQTIITNDNICETFYYNGDATEISQAYPGERVTLSWSGDNVPKGQYVSDFNFSVAGVTAVKNDDNTDYSFLMPYNDVTVTAVTSPQEEFSLDLTTETQVVIPETIYTLMQSMTGYFYSELNAEGTKALLYIDINRDGQPDLQLLPPTYEEELDDEGENTSGNDVEEGEEDEEDPFYYEYSVKRLAGADAVTSNSHFTFVYPQAYKYNKVLVKLNNSFTEAEQPVLEPLDDKYDNSSALAEWAGDGNKHNVIINQRTLYRDGYWNTLCLPFNVDDLDGTPLEGATVMELDVEDKWRLDNEEWIKDNVNGTSQTGLDGTTLYLYFKNASAIKAGVPYIIKWTAAAQDIFEPTFLGVTISSTTAGCVASKDKMVQFQGTYNPITWDTEDQSILFLGDTNTLYYPQPKLKDPSQPFDSDTNPMCYPFLGAFRAYFQINPEQGGGNVREFVLNFDEGSEETIISPAERAEIAERADVWYTVNGVKLSGKPTQKGFYIYKDRKVVIK